MTKHQDSETLGVDGSYTRVPSWEAPCGKQCLVRLNYGGSSSEQDSGNASKMRQVIPYVNLKSINEPLPRLWIEIGIKWSERRTMMGLDGKLLPRFANIRMVWGLSSNQE